MGPCWWLLHDALLWTSDRASEPPCLTHPFCPSHTLVLSHTCSHTHTCSLTLVRTYSHTCSHTFSFSHICRLGHTFSHLFSHMLELPYSFSHFLFSCTFSHPFSHLFSHSFFHMISFVLTYLFHVLILCHSFSHRCVTENVLSFSLCSHTPTFMLVLTFAHFLMLAVSLTLVLVSLLLTFYLTHSRLFFHTHSHIFSYFQHSDFTPTLVLSRSFTLLTPHTLFSHLHLFSLVFSHSPLTLHSHTR